MLYIINCLLILLQFSILIYYLLIHSGIVIALELNKWPLPLSLVGVMFVNREDNIIINKVINNILYTSMTAADVTNKDSRDYNVILVKLVINI